MKFARRVQNVIRFAENGLLVVCLAAMVLVAAYQVIARNFFDSGLLWGDGFVRVLVLWVTMVGAMVASRTDEHIRMDVIARFLPEAKLVWVRRLGSLVTSIVCALFAYYSYQFVRFEFEDQVTAFAQVPAWICEAIMPFAAAIMSLRYLVFIVFPLPPAESQ